MSNQLSDRTIPNRVTFVVPTKNSARTIDACLESIRHQRNADVELIVIDNASDDDTVEMAAAWADLILDYGPERSAQRNAGLWHASGEFVVFIDSDMVLEPEIASQVVAEFSTWPEVGAIVLPELAFGRGRWANARMFEKQISLGDPAVEAARAFRTNDVAAVGGFDESVTGREDWELPDRMVAHGWELGRIEAIVWHDEGLISARDLFRRKRYYGRGTKGYRSNGVRPSGWGRGVRLVAAAGRNPVQGTSLVALKSVEAAGFAVGRLSLR